MNEQFFTWFRANSWAIAIAMAGIISSYTLIGYRVEILENRVTENKVTIESIKASNQNTAIDIARIQTDIAYIKVQLDRIFPTVR